MANRKLVLYHAGCVDGFCAAWLAWRTFGKDADYLPVQYHRPPPDVTARDVLILDFSYPRDTLLAMRPFAASMLVLDHHESAMNDLADLDFCMFDMERSGAMLAWDYFGARLRTPRPWVVGYVQDRDLWHHKLPLTREINAAIGAWQFDFDYWDVNVALGYEIAARDGAAILRFQNQQIDAAMGWARTVNVGPMVIPSSLTPPIVEVPMVNITGRNISEVVGKLAKGKPFAVGWFQLSDGRYAYSLRSDDNGEDVIEIAKRHGGGGHRRAAGFTSTTRFFDNPET